MKTWIALFCFALLAVSPASHAQDSDSLTWARANSCERIRDYIARYPSGRYLAQARAQLTARNCPAPQASAPADPCVQARADWAAIATSSDLGVLRAFRNAAPAACAVQRAQADARIAEVQRAAPQPRSALTPATTSSASLPDARRTPSQTRAPILRNASQLRDFALFRDCERCPEMIVLPAGSYIIGSPTSETGRDLWEGPQRRVTLRSFAVGRFEITFDNWQACLDGGGCRGYTPADAGYGRGRLPVINVSWQDARSYVSWLSGITGEQYRLLSESEWEYMARAGTTTAFYTGASISPSQANTESGRFREVGSFPPNPWGVFDAAGNNAEIVDDCIGEGLGTADGRPNRSYATCNHVVRDTHSGFDPARRARSAARWDQSPDQRNGLKGFRVARTLTT